MNKTTNCALVLIALALAGAGVSYHFTLESRFSAIEQKLDQNSLALQQFQISQETIASSKTDALNNLSKEVDSLQTSLEPLGKATREQTESLADIRKQVASLQQLQQAQQDAQKKLSDYAGQLDKIKHDIQLQASQTPPPAAPVPAPAPARTPPTAAANVTPVATPHASAAGVPMPFPPRADSAVDLRPDDTVLTKVIPPRALPVAIPVALPETLSVSAK
jgi:TolA-binding protein